MEKFLEFIQKKEVIGTIIVIFVTYIIYNLLKFVLEKLFTRGKTEFERKRKKTVGELFKNILKWVLIAIAITIILDMFGVNVSSIVASLGIVSAVGALSFQDTLKDIISGSVIILDNYYVVGDYVTYNGFTGQIIEFGLKATKIMNVDGEVLVVANRNITEITNLSQKTASNLVLAPTAYEEKTSKVEKILEEVVDEIRTWDKVDKNKTSYIGIVNLQDSCVEYGIRIYANYANIWAYRRKALQLIKEKYEKNKIKIPYNQIEVHHGND